MKFSIILAHPAATSFNHALARAAEAKLKQRGHEIWFHDLYAEAFDPIMTAAEFSPAAELPPEIDRHCDEICAADGIMIVHPNWWSQPPAILKGWLDRVLRPGRAYRFVTGPNGEGKPEGLLKARSALVVNTANTPQDQEVALFSDPQAILWQKVVFGLCGVADVHRLVFTPVIISTLDQRRDWLRQVEQTVETVFCRADG